VVLYQIHPVMAAWLFPPDVVTVLLILGDFYRVSGEKMQPFYLESAVFDLKISGDSLIAAGRSSILSYDGTSILSGSPGEFSD
jgi:hypothetical protein